MGWVGIAGGEGRISHLVLPSPTRAETEQVLRAAPIGSGQACGPNGRVGERAPTSTNQRPVVGATPSGRPSGSATVGATPSGRPSGKPQGASPTGIVEKLGAYFRGERVDFDCELDLDGAGDFDRRVWEAAREIGYGETDTYGGIAARIGQAKAARAVGQALGRNPIPVIVPCHRVLRADGSVGGFSAGLDWKTRLLRMESEQ